LGQQVYDTEAQSQIAVEKALVGPLKSRGFQSHSHEEEYIQEIRLEELHPEAPKYLLGKYIRLVVKAKFL
jgi:hypothetical protein